MLNIAQALNPDQAARGSPPPHAQLGRDSYVNIAAFGLEPRDALRERRRQKLLHDQQLQQRAGVPSGISLGLTSPTTVY